MYITHNARFLHPTTVGTAYALVVFRILDAQCLEILYRYNGHHASARQYLNRLRAYWESLAGTAAMERTATARIIVSTAERTRSSAGCGSDQELEKSLAAATPALRRQVEGGIASSPSMNGVQPDLSLPRVFSQQDEDLFVSAILAAVNDYSMPLTNIFSRVQVKMLVTMLVTMYVVSWLFPLTCCPEILIAQLV